jgi:branched-chain amino acid transport system ATP-binding protein
MDRMLQIDGASKSFGGLAALADVSFSVTQGQIKSLIGPNGAGKTTLYNIVTGIEPLTKGAIWFLGERIDGLKPHAITFRGIARTFQNVELFENMSVVENVMLGRHPRTRTGVLGSAFKLPSARGEEQEIINRSLELLEFVGLGQRVHEDSAGLPFGLQRYLEIARALATEPKLLLLDEPASGLDSGEAQSLCELIVKIRDIGVTVLLVEHNMDVAMEISDEIVVLKDNAEVITAYLGDEGYA